MKRVFLSFKAEDKQQVQGLRLLATNPNFGIEFFDESVRRQIQSSNEAYVRQKIREKINRTSVTICMIGYNTHKSRWVNWELIESKKKGNKIIVMALKGINRATLPVEAKDTNFLAWDYERLGRLIQAA